MFSYVKILCFVLTIVRHNSLAYNINFLSPEVFRDPLPGPRRSYFGFSVALYANATGSLVLVGAPRANSTALPRVTEPGTVFKCAPNNNKCKEWVIDKTGNGPHSYDKLRVDQIKNNAWIGATIAARKNEEATRIVVCGPRWINKKWSWYVNGICYATLATSTNNALEKEAGQRLLPLLEESQTIKKKGLGLYNYGMGQAGFSIHMSSLRDRDQVAIGSPGVYNWKGDAIRYTAASAYDTLTNKTIPSIVDVQQLSSVSYFGYAITAGDYFYERATWYASSAPRGGDLFGKVFIFWFTNGTMFTKSAIYGKQFGEYFGNALTSCDINNDGRDELIVGAPLWSRNHGMDEGRVYIFTVHKNNFEEMRTIEGEVLGGRFGSAVTCLGDIDHDGYGDVAVGAPYEEENGGAIYIFNGNGDVFPRKYSQRLTGSIFSSTIRGFGIAISEPQDIDRDRYSDIAVGAYLSDEVVLLKSVPVVTVNVTLGYPQKIKLPSNATSFAIYIWMSYDGSYVPDTLQVVATLKIDQQYGRVVVHGQRADEPQTYRLDHTLLKQNESQNLLDIYFTENIQNIMDPLEISVSVRVQDDLQTRNKSSPCSPCVAINRLRSKLEDTIRLPFAVECGEDDACVSDLSVTLSTNSTGNRYVIGTGQTITVQIHARNRGEPAYNAEVRVLVEVLSLAGVPHGCKEGSRTNNILEMVCKVGNPLRTDKSVTMELITSTVKHDVREVEISAQISSKSDEPKWDDNSYSIALYFDLDIDITIVGKAREDLYWYLRGNTEEPVNSIRFQHFYEVQKFGVSRIEQALLTVKIPTDFQRSDTEYVTIASIDDVTGKLDGYEFHCDIPHVSEISPEASVEFNEIPSTDDDAIVVDQSAVASSNASAKFSTEENATMSMPAANRTLYINCTNEAIHCAELRCVLGPFVNSLSVAKFVATLELQLSHFSADMMKDKDVILYVTEGAIRITDPSNIVQRRNQKPDAASVATTFLGSPVPQRIAVWVLAVSMFLGIVLLLLMALGLIKLGFFNRKKKEALEALKTETEKQNDAVNETSFSTEVLNQD